MSRYDQPTENFNEHLEDGSTFPAETDDTAIKEYQDRVTSELEASIDEFLEFKSFRSLIKLIAEKA